MLSSPERVFVIAEAGVNHDGDLGRARELVDAAADAKADAVKFQTFRARALVTQTAPKAPYQVRTTGGAESQRAMLARLELDADAHYVLVDHCRRRGIEFMSSPFDVRSLRFLVEGCDVGRIKIGSGELTNGPLLHAAGRSGRSVILSTGMSDLPEIHDALGVLAMAMVDPDAAPLRRRRCGWQAIPGAAEQLARRLTLLHCNTAYPTPVSDVNLRAMDTLRRAFSVEVGYSDHTLGLTVPLAAAALGARVIEKHLTLDRSARGPDHEASLEPDEFAQMVRMIRESTAALGSGTKAVSPSEEPQRAIARKSLVAATSLAPGEPLRPEQLECKRPGTGLSPMDYWDVLGRVVGRDHGVDELLSSDSFAEASASARSI